MTTSDLCGVFVRLTRSARARRSADQRLPVSKARVGGRANSSRTTAVWALVPCSAPPGRTIARRSLAAMSHTSRMVSLD